MVSGTNSSEFDNPTYLTIYNVSDTNNHHIILQWGKEGKGNGEFDYPYGIVGWNELICC